MRVVAGRFKGRTLHAPKGRSTRPTSDKVREALFSVLGDVTGAHTLDLYAGSGALGIEALSRGAASVTFVDDDERALAAIRRNVDAVGAAEVSELARRDALAFLRAGAGPFDLVFVDPPYSSAPRLGEPLTRLLPAVLSNDGRIVTESDKRAPLRLDLPLVLERIYGDTRIAIQHG
jgi:16S rRNA (guanine966-N2)-methyltransferase